MSDKSTEDRELNNLWSLFKDSPEEIQERRQKITKLIHDGDSLSFPHQMSMMTAFDELLGCFALGGQVKNYYRYGSYSNCEKEREKFWFAIKNGNLYESNTPFESLSPREIERAVKIQEFYKKRLLEDKAKGSSEDIWDIRSQPLKNPFGNE